MINFDIERFIQNPINEFTNITKGFPLSNNFILGHVTSGAFHYVLGKWIPQFPIQLLPGMSQNTPLWQIAQNLQGGAQSILEPLLRNFGNELIIKAGLTKENLGKFFDIQINGFQGNMFNVTKEIQNVIKKAESFELLQGATSTLRINFDPKTLINKTDIPIFTKDIINNVVKEGLQQVKGFI